MTNDRKIEAKLNLISIFKVQDIELRHRLLDTLLDCLFEEKKDVKTDNQDVKSNNQFEQIAELIEEELKVKNLPKNLLFIPTHDLMRREIESVGIEINSNEELEFTCFLDKRWSNFSGRI